jgi:ATP-dependent helicase/nuclease subunit A
LAKSDVEYPVRRESAFGMSWGRVVHSVLEQLGRGHFCEPGGLGTRELADPVLARALDLLLENALAVEDRDSSEKARLRHLIDTISGSDFWRRAMLAPTCLLEVPFSLKASGLELGRDDRLPVILSGVIDLVFLESMDTHGEGSPQFGWVIADYKTDEIVDDLQKYVDYYAPQVLLYSRYWSQLTGHPVKETGLYFTYLDHWICVEGVERGA